MHNEANTKRAKAALTNKNAIILIPVYIIIIINIISYIRI